MSHEWYRLTLELTFVECSVSTPTPAMTPWTGTKRLGTPSYPAHYPAPWDPDR